MAQGNRFVQGQVVGNMYRVGSVVGSGTYGTVYEAVHVRRPNVRMSLKQTVNTHDDHPVSSSTLRELAFLSEVNHPHIIHPLTSDIICNVAERSISFAYEYAICDVSKLIRLYAKKQMPIEPVVVKSIMFQLLLALEHIHSRSIAHCDLTPSNLVLMPKSSPTPGTMKLIDFGLSRVMDDTGSERNFGIVTEWYRAPELLLGDRFYTEAIDLWAAGCIFGELSSGQVLFAKQTNKNLLHPQQFNPQQLERIQEVLGPLPIHELIPQNKFTHFNEFAKMPIIDVRTPLKNICRDMTPNGFDLLEKMLLYNPQIRITAHDALRHEYFNESPLPVSNILRVIPERELRELEMIGANPPEK